MSLYSRYLRPLFFSPRFYLVFSGLIILFVLAYFLPFLFLPVQLLAGFFLLIVLIDYANLFFGRRQVTARRILPDRFSNGDHNEVAIELVNGFAFRTRVRVIDELPVQFQRRDFQLSAELASAEKIRLEYSLRPVERGEYAFGLVRLYVRTPLQLVVRRFDGAEPQMVRVFPSYLSLRQFELMAHASNLTEAGARKIRKIGHSLEFEQIKEYVTGDDIRTINWKATARMGGQLMVNRFTDEKSQQVYCLIDKGRSMKMPFEGMSLLDYAINATLVVSRVALIRQDRTGLLCFDHQGGQFLLADRRPGQMSQILETLYNQQTRYFDSDFEKLFSLVRTRITQRSLLLLFTNFESLSALRRQLPYIRTLAKNHLLLLILFENTELKSLIEQPATDIETLYSKTIAEKFAYEKRLIVKELQMHGIATILSTPAQLSVNTVNKYLELKARQAI